MTALGPSPHLSWKELACHDGTPYPEDWRSVRAPLLAREFEALRALAGVPLLVVSAYRTPAWNKRVGGAKRSQHLEGRALDLVPARGLSLETLGKLAHARAQDPDSLIRGIGYYPTFLHIDIRPGPRLVVWHDPPKGRK